MTTKQIAGVNVDAEGFMTDPAQWTREIAAAVAQDEGIPLGAGH